jgi:zinc D-Ala-D-Ala carboxypeptidase
MVNNMKDLWPYIRNFRRSEFACKSGDAPDTADLMSIRLVFALDSLRSLIYKPFIINSAYRTKAHNEAIGGAPASAHMTGEAVDIRTVGWGVEDKRDFIIYARKLGFTGVGIAPTFIHIDIKPRIASWIYRDGKTIAIKLGDEVKYI